jgi:hypothetical protein
MLSGVSSCRAIASRISLIYVLSQKDPGSDLGGEGPGDDPDAETDQEGDGDHAAAIRRSAWSATLRTAVS